MSDQVQFQRAWGNIYRRGRLVTCSYQNAFRPNSPPADIVAPVEREIRLLANGLTAVKDEQEYIVVREKVHRNTAESTNTRVKWWSVLQAAVLFAVVGWQVYYLKVCLLFDRSTFMVLIREQSFFEVKRVI